MTFWDFCAPIYDFAQGRNSAYKKMVKAVSGLVADGAEVMEVAAGTGDISIAVSKRARSALCTDLSDNMLAKARRKAATRGLTNIRFSKMSIYRIDARDGAFDVVVASQVLHLLDEPEKAAAELRRVSRNLVIMPLALIKDLRGIQKLKINLWKLFGFNPKHNFDASGYKDFLRGLGFDELSVEVVDGDMPMAIAVWRKTK